MKPLQILAQLEVEDRHRKYPSMPKNYIIPTKWSDKTANGLTACVVKFIEYSGFQAERINNLGRRVDNTKEVTDVLGIRRVIGSVEYQKGSGTKGTSDVKSIIKGRSVSWEIKIGADRQSQAQKDYQAAVERAGGYYFVVRSFDDFFEKYSNLLLDIGK